MTFPAVILAGKVIQQQPKTLPVAVSISTKNYSTCFNMDYVALT